MGRPNPPRDYSKVLLPVAIDEIAANDPHRAWASLPVDDWDLAKGFEDISYAAFANAINKISHALEDAFGPSSTLETFAYMGVPDIRYHMVQMAAIKTGYKVLFSSQLNSTNIHLSLMERSECVALLSAVGIPVKDILRARTMKHATIAELDDLLDLEDLVPAYPFKKTYEDAALEPYLIVHSSGVTGNPKPVVYNHAFYANTWSIVFLPDVDGRTHFTDLLYPGRGTRFLLVVPPYHAMSATTAVAMSVFGQGILCPGFRHRAITTSDICSFLDHAKVTKAVLAPWMMEHIARQPNAQKYIEPFESVLFGSAILSPFASSMWAKYTRIQNGWSATESISPPVLTADPEDHAYVYFDMAYSGIEFRKSKVEYFDDGSSIDLYEVVFTMNEKTAPYATWHVRQGITLESQSPPYPEYAIGDLWTPHPDPKKAAYAWRFMGRVDDIFTLSTGEGIHPGPLEAEIGVHAKVRGVIIVGNQRQQPVALIEVAEGIETTPEVAAEIWQEAIAPANECVSAHSKISRTHVALVSSGGFERAPVGKIMRKKTEAKFQELLVGVYEEFGDKWQSGLGRSGIIIATTHIQVDTTEG